jgi:UDP-N-acetylglucosamine--N-acetylmuramyl-(pentapeptide) pyrophosphoryl-undecaprenol N-acetylglucosamine transferase
MKKIVITGGHLTPALAVIKKLQKEGGWKILFIGRKHTMEGDKGLSIESQLIPQLGVNFVHIEAGRFQRKLTRYFLPAILKIPLGFLQAFGYVRNFKPDIILSFGSYLALPVVLVGWLSGVPVISHEQAVVPGLATKLISLFAQKTAISWKETQKYLPKNKVVLTGNPIREEILKVSHTPYLPCRQAGAIHHTPTVYITGGNQGSHVINETVNHCLPKLLEKYRIIHQCGTVEYYGDYEKLKAKSSKLKAPLRNRYRLARWFNSEELSEIFEQVDLVVSRAGANIVTELAFLAKPAILIPFPLGKEQQTNARILSDVGLARIISQEELSSERLFEEIKLQIKNLKTYQKKAAKAKKIVISDASERLIAELKKCLKREKEKSFS